MGQPFTLPGKSLAVDYDYLYEGSYQYAFCITDIYGDTYITEPAFIEVDDRGEVTFTY